ncbi:MAG TPA: hypothetical protein VM056_03580 [Terriglobales bacterium]|nr:hypothetical protein [Terriglobales bacterium]
MFSKLLQVLSISCGHRKTSQPFAAAAMTRSVAGSSWDKVMPSGKHYVVCLDCGKKFDYDWKEMRIVS